MSAVVSTLQRAISGLELEERILSTAALVAVVGVLCPWLSGEWLGGEFSSYSGFGFFTSFLGLAVWLLLLATLLTFWVPLITGWNLVPQRHRHGVRLVLSSQAVILTLACLSVLAEVTLEFSHMELRFGIYLTLIGGLVATLYSGLLYREQRRRDVRELFHHPEDLFHRVKQQEVDPSPLAPPPPPPPPPLRPEDHPVLR
jgi:hypothetical protein